MKKIDANTSKKIKAGVIEKAKNYEIKNGKVLKKTNFCDFDITPLNETRYIR